MPVREATLNDLPALEAMGERFYAHSGYGGTLPYSEASVRAVLTGLIASATGAVLVAEVDGKPVGGIIGALMPVWFAPEGSMMAVDLAWWVEPRARGAVSVHLVRAFEAWAKAQGASCVALGSMTTVQGAELTDKMKQRLGYRPGERIYFRSL